MMGLYCLLKNKQICIPSRIYGGKKHFGVLLAMPSQWKRPYHILENGLEKVLYSVI